jgi:hypothetical protein
LALAIFALYRQHLAGAGEQPTSSVP